MLKIVHFSIPVPIPLPPVLPECYTNSECSDDKRCINSLCVNPCVVKDPCGRNALCHANNHSPVCRCPANYIGDPRSNCVPRKCFELEKINMPIRITKSIYHPVRK